MFPFLKKIRTVDRFIIMLFMSISIGLCLALYLQNYNKDFVAELELVYRNSKFLKKSINLDEETALLKSNDILRKVVLLTSFLNPENMEEAINRKSTLYRSNISISKGSSENSIHIKTISRSGKIAVLMATALVDAYIDFKKKEVIKFSDKAKFTLSKKTESLIDQIKDDQSNLEQISKKADIFEVGGKVKRQIDRYIDSGELDIMPELMSLDESLHNIQLAISQRPKNELLESIHLKGSFAYAYFQYIERKLLDLEFDKFLLLQSFPANHDSVRKKESFIRNIKAEALGFLKKTDGSRVGPEDELDFSLFMQQMSAQIKKRLYVQLMKKRYVDKDLLTLNQIEFLSLKKDLEGNMLQYNLLLEKSNEQSGELKTLMGQTVATVRSVTTPSSNVPILNFIFPIIIGSIGGLLGGSLVIWFRINYKRQTSLFSFG